MSPDHHRILSGKMEEAVHFDIPLCISKVMKKETKSCMPLLNFDYNRNIVNILSPVSSKVVEYTKLTCHFSTYVKKDAVPAQIDLWDHCYF